MSLAGNQITHLIQTCALMLTLLMLTEDAVSWVTILFRITTLLLWVIVVNKLIYIMLPLINSTKPQGNVRFIREALLELNAVWI